MPEDGASGKELREGRYALVRTLGEGAQGETWEAIDRGGPRAKASETSLADRWDRYVSVSSGKELAKPPPTKTAPGRDAGVVAIKAFRLGKAKAWKDVELAEREARTLSSLDHPKLPRYVEHFEEDGALYLVMEKIEGESLAAIRKSGRTLGANDVRRMLEDAAEALRYLHGRAPAIVHRDIKPGNVIRRPDGSFALVDFGAVRDRLKPEGGSTVVGTFGYMAPEQFQGRASPKSDVYGVGATALTLLTGCEPEDLPHQGLGIDVARAVPAGTSPGLVRALRAMLEPDPDRRVASVEEALALLVEPASRSAAPPPMSDREARHARRREERLEKKLRKAAQKAEKRARKAAQNDARDEHADRHRRPLPIAPRLIARAGLLVAFLAVWLAAGLIAPVVLIVLSVLFGERMRDAARSSVAGMRRAHAAIARASARLSGREPEPEPAPARVRIEADRVRAVTENEAQRIAIAEAEEHGEDADAWLEAKIEAEARKERMQRHAQPPPGASKRKNWGR